MSTSLISIEISGKKGKEVLLKIKIINPAEYYFYAKKNFALQILWEPVQIFDKPDCAMAKSISVDQITDETWVLENENKYIADIIIMSTKNYPSDPELESLNRKQFDEFREKNGIPEAEFRIAVTEDKWIEHIQPGMKWESTSYNMEA